MDLRERIAKTIYESPRPGRWGVSTWPPDAREVPYWYQVADNVLPILAEQYTNGYDEGVRHGRWPSWD